MPRPLRVDGGGASRRGRAGLQVRLAQLAHHDPPAGARLVEQVERERADHPGGGARPVEAEARLAARRGVRQACGGARGDHRARPVLLGAGGARDGAGRRHRRRRAVLAQRGEGERAGRDDCRDWGGRGVCGVTSGGSVRVDSSSPEDATPPKPASRGRAGRAERRTLRWPYDQAQSAEGILHCDNLAFKAKGVSFSMRRAYGS
mmetsp:Transcript_23872/g.54734  ORF Transcript_23872/g.54734 Transcript_23872/m.54734 type:complete len:204 (-) Transcript_23872:50-661(-)